MDQLFTSDINLVDWDKTNALLTLLLLFFQLMISSFLTWKIIKQSQNNLDIQKYQNDIEYRIQLLDKRVEIYQIGQYIKSVINENVIRIKSNIQIEFCFSTIQNSIRKHLFTTTVNNELILNNEIINKKSVMDSADIFFDSELIESIQEAYDQFIGFIMVFYNYNEYSQLNVMEQDVYIISINKLIDIYSKIEKDLDQMRKEIIVRKKIT